LIISLRSFFLILDPATFLICSELLRISETIFASGVSSGSEAGCGVGSSSTDSNSLSELLFTSSSYIVGLFLFEHTDNQWFSLTN
jgi:hypothetical protein